MPLLVCLLPGFLMTGFKVQRIPVIGPPIDSFLTTNGLSWITTGLGVPFYFGGAAHHFNAPIWYASTDRCNWYSYFALACSISA